MRLVKIQNDSKHGLVLSKKKRVLATKRLTLFIYLKDVFLYARHLSTYSHRRCSNVIIQKVSNFTIKWIHELECNFILYLRWQTIIVTLSRPTVIDVFKIDVNNNTRLVTCLWLVCMNRWQVSQPINNKNVSRFVPFQTCTCRVIPQADLNQNNKSHMLAPCAAMCISCSAPLSLQLCSCYYSTYYPAANSSSMVQLTPFQLTNTGQWSF